MAIFVISGELPRITTRIRR